MLLLICWVSEARETEKLIPTKRLDDLPQQEGLLFHYRIRELQLASCGCQCPLHLSSFDVMENRAAGRIPTNPHCWGSCSLSQTALLAPISKVTNKKTQTAFLLSFSVIRTKDNKCSECEVGFKGVLV